MNEEEIYESISNKTLKKQNDSKEIKEPIYEMTIESEKGRKEIINIYSNSKPEEIAYNFCKENNLDFETLELMVNQIKKLMKSISNKADANEKEKNDEEKENKLFYCNEPILEDPEEQSLSTEKIKKTKSFKENVIKNKEKEKNISINNNNDKINKFDKNNDIEINNNKSDIDNNIIDSNKNMNYIKINGDFKEKRQNFKTSSIITNTINNCLELIEKEEKLFSPNNNSSLSSKIGTSSVQNRKYSLNSKENINVFNLEKDKEKEIENIKNDNAQINIQTNSYNSFNHRSFNISKSFVNKIPKNFNNINNVNSITSNNRNCNSRNNYLINYKSNNNNSNNKNNKKIAIELDSKNKTVRDEHKYLNKNNIKSLKNSEINFKKNINIPNSKNNYEYYTNKQKEILKNNKNKNFQRIINMIKKNTNKDINQMNESLTKSNHHSKKKKIQNNIFNNNNEQKIKNNINYKIKTNNNIHYGINKNQNNIKMNNINNKYLQNSKDNYIYYDNNEKDPFYSLSKSKNEENSSLNYLIKNSMSTNSHYFSNLNSIKHEINMTILSKQQKKINIPTPKNKKNNILTNKNNKAKYRNCQTLSNPENKKHFLSHDKLFKDFKSKILLTKNNSKSKKENSNQGKNKLSPTNDKNKKKINNTKKKFSFLQNVGFNSPQLIKEFFNETNLKKYRNNFKSPQHKASTTQTTMKNFIIKKNKTNMYKDSFISSNNNILLTQSSRNYNLNNYSSLIKQRCKSFNDFNSNNNNIFINLKYSNNRKNPSLLGFLEKYNLDNNNNNSGFLHQKNKKKIAKKRNKSHAFSSYRINSNSNNSLGNYKKSINNTIDKAFINNKNSNLNITTDGDNNSYSYKNKKKISANYCTNLKNKLNKRSCSKSNLNKKRPCYLFIKSQNSSPPSTSREQRKKNNHSTLLQNSRLTINLLKKNKISKILKEIFYCLSNKNNQIDVFKINKNNAILPDDIIKSVLCIIQNCERNKNIITIKEFILKGTILFDSFPFEEQISILNFSYDK